MNAKGNNGDYEELRPPWTTTANERRSCACGRKRRWR